MERRKEVIGCCPQWLKKCQQFPRILVEHNDILIRILMYVPDYKYHKDTAFHSFLLVGTLCLFYRIPPKHFLFVTKIDIHFLYLSKNCNGPKLLIWMGCEDYINARENVFSNISRFINQLVKSKLKGNNFNCTNWSRSFVIIVSVFWFCMKILSGHY